MSKIIEQIINDIQKAPRTFINLASSADSYIEVFGPGILGNKTGYPRYGFDDYIIQNAELGDVQTVVDRNSYYCGSIFSMDPKIEDGAQSLPLMMRLARAGVITPTNFSDSLGLVAWSATSEAGKEMNDILKGTGIFPSQVAGNIRKALSPNSDIDAARSLCARINENYL